MIIRFQTLYRSAAFALLLLVPSGFAQEVQPVLRVTREGGDYRSIQAAIDAAPDGAVVSVGPGTWTETVRISKPVTLRGAGVDQTVIAAPHPTPEELARKVADFKAALQLVKEMKDGAALFRKFAAEDLPPAVRIAGAKGVTLTSLKIAGVPTYGGDGSPLNATELAVIQDADSTIDRCVIAGSSGSGLAVHGASDVTVSESLVAGHWWAGITVDSGPGVRVTVDRCDVRNCYLSGITIRRDAQVTVRDSRISKTAWHGIRYDDASPTITHNRIFGVARCGIYASGRTAAKVEGNLFCDNEMDGMACWFDNRDTVVGNTFATNAREGVMVIGGAKPRLERNIFSGHPTAIVNSWTDKARELGAPVLVGNWFWNNQTEKAERREGSNEPVAVTLALDTTSERAEPPFVAADKKDFTLPPDSAAAKAKVGVASPLTGESPYPLQAEEKAIMPKPGSADWREWKKGTGEGR